MCRTIERGIDRAVRSDANVLIVGETGVGKETVARLIHDRSARRLAPFVVVNCAGLPDSLLESELSGHVRGSFMGAYSDKTGRLEMAANGTLFLGEVGQMSARMQVVLLRFLATGGIRPVGAARPRARVDVRLMAATTRDLRDHVLAGAFREDLYCRLNDVRLAIPALRDRTSDIPLLVGSFLHLHARQCKAPALDVSATALDALVSYRWPGNVRELKNTVARIVLRGHGSAVSLDDLPPEISRRGAFRPAAVSIEARQSHAG